MSWLRIVSYLLAGAFLLFCLGAPDPPPPPLQEPDVAAEGWQPDAASKAVAGCRDVAAPRPPRARGPTPWDINPREGPVALVAVGDVAAASGLDAPVAALTARIGPDGLLLLGDTVQDTGSPREFHERFDPDWSQFRETWMPVVGNHEYRTPDAAGFRSYFNRPSGPLFTCWRLGDWYVIGLDSKKPWNRKQLRWLRALLAGTKGHPKLVAWHRPRFSSGARGDQLGTHFLWDAAKRDPDVRLVLWGHDHDYERMRVPLGRGRSVLAMVVGTGGGTLDEPTPTMAARPWRQAFVDHTTGVLALHLGASGFSWSFLDVDGHVLDKGSSPL